MVKILIAVRYIVAILAIGMIAGRKVKTAEEFSVAGRSIPSLGLWCPQCQGSEKCILDGNFADLLPLPFVCQLCWLGWVCARF